jgi:hypothetical protein
MSYACQRAGLRVKSVPLRFVERGISKMPARTTIEATWRV